MATRVNANLLEEIKQYGDINVEDCFNCGNCTAICPLSTDETPFPRNNMRLLQLGLKDEILQSTDPWLCYYCGQCSETCPREAEPAEAQMTMRRWLTAQYDWTGLAKKFYTSPVWEIGSLLVVGALVLVLILLLHGPVVTDQVELNTFAPVEIVHLGDWIMAGLLSFFLLTNVYRMFHFIMHNGTDTSIPPRIYFTELWQIIYHAATQIRFSGCEEEEEGVNMRWISHLLLVSGYVLMFALVVGFLPWFQTDNIYPITHPQRWLGYYATIVLMYGSVDALWGRIKKEHEMHRFSHLSDWLFPILLLLTTLTGILVHTFRYLGAPMATYVSYTIHLIILTPMLVLEVPFGKWAHLAYRPLAVYFQAVKEKAKADQKSAQEALAAAK
jgi:heterodisulfide reductase subunit C